MLYALQAALLDAHWAELPGELKERLRHAVSTQSSSTQSFENTWELFQPSNVMTVDDVDTSRQR